ncbi:hypothetical protein M2175_001237 [Bradyrhizobium elkanii]|nr:hypothetical protein [Bradyrhizobium elkanii]MCS3966758.1 hypothetical protein [Bradyrhizobium japonicum]
MAWERDLHAADHARAGQLIGHLTLDDAAGKRTTETLLNDKLIV